MPRLDPTAVNALDTTDYLVPVVVVEVRICDGGIVCRLEHNGASRYLELSKSTIQERYNAYAVEARGECVHDSWVGGI